MAAPAFGSAGTQLQGSGSTMNVDVPDGVAAGDIIVVTAYVDLGTVTVTGLETDFQHAPDSPVSVAAGTSGAHSFNVMWKRATAADSTAGTYNFTLSASTYRNAQAIRYTGAVASGDPWDVTASADGGASASTTTPAVSDTTTVADTLLVFTGTNWAGGTWTPPGTFTERRDSGDGVCTVADKAQAVAGATGSITATCTGTGHTGAWLGALKADVAVESSAYTRAMLPGRIGPDRRVYLPKPRLDTSNIQVDTSAPAGVASASASALGAVADIDALAVAPTAAGVAPQPTVLTGTVAPAGLAAATAAANVPTVSIAPTGGLSAATGAANQPVARLGVLAGNAAVTGVAGQPTVTTLANTNAPAGLASATAAANAPTSFVRPNASTGGAAASAPGSVALVGVRAAATAVTGTAPQPTALTVKTAFAGLAAAASTAAAPTGALGVLAEAAVVAATAPQAVGQGELPVEPISDPLELAALTEPLYLGAIDSPLTLEALED